MVYKFLEAEVHKVWGAHLLAISLTFSDLNDFLKALSLTVALFYGIWTWVVAYKRERRLRQSEMDKWMDTKKE